MPQGFPRCDVQRMKKRIFLTFLLPLLVLALAFSVSAEGTTIPEEFASIVDDLPSEVSGRLPKEIYSRDAEVAFDGILEVLSLEYLSGFIADIIGLNIGGAVALFATILGIIILSYLQLPTTSESPSMRPYFFKSVSSIN